MIFIKSYNSIYGVKNMKNIYYYFFALVTIIAVVGFSGCSSMMETVMQRPSQVSEEESATSEKEAEEETSQESAETGSNEIIGIWVNPDYNGEGRSAKLVYTERADGTIIYKAYDNSDGSGNVYSGEVEYKKMWVDSEGRRVGKSVVTLEGGMSWETLDRISVDGTTLEVQSGVDKIDPNGPRYSIYYRQ
jgi:hypothetical protein